MKLTTALAILALGLPARSPEAQELDMKLYRTFVPPNLTLVEGLFRVGPEMLGDAEACRYTVRLAVSDASGTPLVRNEWKGQCPEGADGRPAAALETFSFAVHPARYTIDLSVVPEGKPDAVLNARDTVEPLPQETLASDLFLARSVAWMDSTKQGIWTFRKGDLGIHAASEIVATERDPSIGYYLEVYPDSEHPISGKLIGAVKRPDGKVLARLPLQTLADVAESRPLAGNFSVAGLAPGDYELEARLELGDTVIVRSHPFRMANAAAVVAQTAGDVGYFWTLDDAELARLFEPVVLYLDKRDRELFEGLNPDGRRRFLQQHFGGLEPTGQGLQGNALDIYIERVRAVATRYSEQAGEGRQPGWRTDRGRIYLMRGEPTQIVDRPVSRDGSPPYQIWQYSTSPGYVYLFLDESRFGNFRLIFTTDPNQASLPGWERRVGAEAMQDLNRIGVRGIGRNPGSGN
jgi:GWxTD domain-containing protein